MIPNAWAGFDFGLGPDVEMLRKTVSGFAQDRIAPRAEQIDRDNVFPRDLWPEMGALGLHGITVDEEYRRRRAWAISNIAWRWRRFRALPPRSGCPTAPIPTSASTSSAATAMPNRRRNICPS